MDDVLEWKKVGHVPGLWIVVLLIVVFTAAAWEPNRDAMADHMGWRGTTDASAAAFADAREITLEAGDLWFEPERIEVTAGAEVNLRMDNNGSTFHDLTVPAAELMLDVNPGDEVVGGIRLDEPGTYDFFCSVAGHAEAGMRGVIVAA